MLQLIRATWALAAAVTMLAAGAHAADVNGTDAAGTPGWNWSGFYAGVGLSAGLVHATPDTLVNFAVINGVD